MPCGSPACSGLGACMMPSENSRLARPQCFDRARTFDVASSVPERRPAPGLQRERSVEGDVAAPQVCRPLPLQRPVLKQRVCSLGQVSSALYTGYARARSDVEPSRALSQRS